RARHFDRVAAGPEEEPCAEPVAPGDRRAGTAPGRGGLGQRDLHELGRYARFLGRRPDLIGMQAVDRIVVAGRPVRQAAEALLHAPLRPGLKLRGAAPERACRLLGDRRLITVHRATTTYGSWECAGRRCHNSRVPRGTSRSGTQSATSPCALWNPVTRHSEATGPICFFGKLITPTTSRP